MEPRIILFLAVVVGLGVGVFLLARRSGGGHAMRPNPQPMPPGVPGQPPPPRAQHYLFAHRLLPSVMLKNPERFPTFRAMTRDGVADRSLLGLWNGAKEMAIEAGRHEPVSGVPTAVTIEDGVLIRMPAPQGMAEAHLIAVVETAKGIRYFTLEKSVEQPCLCEWTNDVHANLGPFANDERAFLAKVASLGRG